MRVAMMVREFDKNTRRDDHERKGSWDGFIYMDGRETHGAGRCMSQVGE
jgi:hypothetical protein